MDVSLPLSFPLAFKFLPSPRVITTENRYGEGRACEQSSFPEWPATLNFIAELDQEPTMTATQCVFCEVLAGRAPGDIVYEDELTAAFIDPRQHNPGHVLVVPRVHISDIRHLDPQTGAGLMEALIKIARAVDQAFPSQGMSLWHSVGLAAFQEVPHMHMHVHPRKLGDGMLRVYPGVPVDAEPRLRTSYAERLRQVLRYGLT